MLQRLLRLSTGVILLFAAGCQSIPKPPSGPVLTQRLTVSRHTSAQLNNSRADQILREMSLVLRAADSSRDVACGVDFVRDGEVGVFAAGNGSIHGEADFDAVLAQPGVVKVVNQIYWCGTFSPNILGCAPIGGESMAVVRWHAELEGILWLHEYGHLRGLGHRNEAGAVMNAVLEPNHRAVDELECSFIKP